MHQFPVCDAVLGAAVETDVSHAIDFDHLGL